MRLWRSGVLLMLIHAEPALAQAKKIGFVDVRFVYENTYLKDRYAKSLEEFTRTGRAARDKLEREIIDLNKEFYRAASLSDPTEADIETYLNARTKKETLLQTANAELKKIEALALRDIYDEMLPALQQVSESSGVDILLDREAVIFYKGSSIDLSPAVIEYLNAQKIRELPVAK